MAKTTYSPSGAKIKVIGVGGAGCNAITRMVREQMRGVEFIAMNTDAQHLEITEASVRIQFGERITRGLGAGGEPISGQKAAEQSYDEIKQALAGADMIFVVAGMGGGTGTGSAPVVAQIAKEGGALTVAVVTKPFTFEGNRRNEVAEQGIMNLLDKVDTLVIIPNDRLLDLCDPKTGVDSAFKLADEMLSLAVQVIAGVVTVPGLINLDFADIRTIIKGAGPAWMSVGRGTGQNRATDAAKEALASPLLDVSIAGAKGLLFNVAGGSNLTLSEVSNAAEVIRQAVDPEANVIFGVVLDPSMGNDVRIVLIATGFAHNEALPRAAREVKGEEEIGVPSLFRLTGKTVKKYDIFLSYSIEDREWVRFLADALSEKGLRVWYDDKEIRTGDYMIDRVEEGLRGSAHVVFVISPKTAHSNWLAAELGAALALQKSLIPIVGDDVRLEDLPGPIKIRKFLPKDEPRAMAEKIASIVASERKSRVA